MVAFVDFYLIVTKISVQCLESSRIFQAVDTTCHAEEGMRITNLYGVQPTVFDEECRETSFFEANSIDAANLVVTDWIKAFDEHSIHLCRAK